MRRTARSRIAFVGLLALTAGCEGSGGGLGAVLTETVSVGGHGGEFRTTSFTASLQENGDKRNASFRAEGEGPNEELEVDLTDLTQRQGFFIVEGAVYQQPSCQRGYVLPADAARGEFPGDLSLCRRLETTGSEDRRRLRRFFAREILRHPELRPKLHGLPHQRGREPRPLRRLTRAATAGRSRAQTEGRGRTHGSRRGVEQEHHVHVLVRLHRDPCTSPSTGQRNRRPGRGRTAPAGPPKRRSRTHVPRRMATWRNEAALAASPDVGIGARRAGGSGIARRVASKLTPFPAIRSPEWARSKS